MQTESVIDIIERLRKLSAQESSKLGQAARFANELVCDDRMTPNEAASRCASFQMGVEYAMLHPEHAQAWLHVVQGSREGDLREEFANEYDVAVRRYPMTSHD